jgi:ABC-type transport system involved in multi-copper enzyme maturation permease subunit
MQQTLAITFLTLKAALRYRLVLILGVLLILGVFVLPLIIEHDGTARGFTQIILTYTLSLITALLGFSTLWLSCGILAREMEEAQLQMVVVKPIARWQIWIGKWLGIMILNASLLILAGGVVYGLMMWRASNLSPKEKEVLNNEVFVARAAAREPMPDYRETAFRILQDRFKDGPPQGVDPEQVERYVVARVKAEYELVHPQHLREWRIDLGNAEQLRDQPIYIRAKFNSSEISPSGTFEMFWEVGSIEATRNLLSESTFRNDPGLHIPGSYCRTNISMSADSATEFKLPPNLFDKDGVIRIRFYNYTEYPILFPLEDGLEALVRKGGFGLNYARGLGVIFCWLALLSAVGLAASTFLAFPVAAFCSIGLLIISFSTGTFKQIVDEGGIVQINQNTGYADEPNIINTVAVFFAKGMLWLLNLARGFSPIDYLSSGRLLSWGEFASALFQICVVLGGLFAAIGIAIFNRRELATAQTSH